MSRWHAVTHVTGLRWADRMPRWALLLLLAALLAASWVIVYVAGGTRSAWPHVFYVPILLAALPFGLPGGLAAGVAAALLCGPAMPLDVISGEAQSAANWMARGTFFVVIGSASGVVSQSLREGYERGLADWFNQHLDRAQVGSEPDPEVRAQLADVVASRRFRPVFQPIYALDDGRLVAVEALTRFEADPLRPPNVWFEQAGQVGLGFDLEFAAIEEALRAVAELDADVPLSLNSSPMTLADRRLLTLLDDHPGRQLIVEVTEHEVIDDYDYLNSALRDLRARGVLLAVDDAGAGMSSLRHIVALAPDFIKLDASLTRHVRNDPVRMALANALVRFADESGTRLIVEGIEGESDLRAWQDLGTYAAQGYLLGRPGPLPVAPWSALVDHGAGNRASVRSLFSGDFAASSS